MKAVAATLLAASLAMPVKAHVKADRVVVDKTARTLKVFSDGRQIASFAVALGRQPGRKECEHDGRTPEGSYVVAGRKADSAYHRALRLSYPGAKDVAHARGIGCRPGGDIMIHGLRNGFGWIGRLHAKVNWTRGCIAVTDAEIEQLWDLVPDGTTVEIRA